MICTSRASLVARLRCAIISDNVRRSFFAVRGPKLKVNVWMILSQLERISGEIVSLAKVIK